MTNAITSKPLDAAFLADVVEGLTGSPKTLPCKYFYDERGSALFDEITELEAYYPTRTETAIRSATSLRWPPRWVRALCS